MCCCTENMRLPNWLGIRFSPCYQGINPWVLWSPECGFLSLHKQVIFLRYRFLSQRMQVLFLPARVISPLYGMGSLMALTPLFGYKKKSVFAQNCLCSTLRYPTKISNFVWVGYLLSMVHEPVTKLGELGPIHAYQHKWEVKGYSIPPSFSPNPHNLLTDITPKAITDLNPFQKSLTPNNCISPFHTSL